MKTASAFGFLIVSRSVFFSLAMVLGGSSCLDSFTGAIGAKDSGAPGKSPVRDITVIENNPLALSDVEAFRTTVYPLVRANCVLCHGATQAPFFASPQITEAHAAALTRTLFDSIPDSLLVQKTKDSHCGSACATNGGAMTAAIQQWAALRESSAPPVVSFSMNASSVSENSGTVALQVRLDKAGKEEITVPFTLSGSALSGSDFVAIPLPQVKIAKGATSANLSLSLVDDSIAEVAKTLVITLGQPDQATLGGAKTHTLTINDNDPDPRVSFVTGTQSVTEGAMNVSIVASLSGPTSKAVTVPYVVSGTATSGTDHTLASGSLSIAPGQLNATLTFQIADDGLAEGAETIIVTLGAAVNATAGTVVAHTVTIADKVVVAPPVNTPPSVQFTLASQTVPESAGNYTAVVALSAVSTTAVTVPVTLSGTAASGQDYSLNAATITIPAGSTQGSATLAIVEDTLDEANETLILTLGTPTGATLGNNRTHTLTLTDNDNAPTVQWTLANQTVQENIGVRNVSLGLSAASSFTITVPYTLGGTATAGSDYTGSNGTVTIAAGQTSGSATVTIVNDGTVESTEELTLTIGTPTNATRGANSVHTIVINDDDVLANVGVEKFRTTVYPITRQQCVACHATTVNPYFASGNIDNAYTITKTKVNFNVPEVSALVLRSMDGHCGGPCMTDGKVLAEAIRQWALIEAPAPPPPVAGASPSPSPSSPPIAGMSPSPVPTGSTPGSLNDPLSADTVTIGRMSGDTLWVRLQALFPAARDREGRLNVPLFSDYSPMKAFSTGNGFSREFPRGAFAPVYSSSSYQMGGKVAIYDYSRETRVPNLYSSIMRPVMSADRNTSPVSMVMARRLFTDLCDGNNLTGSKVFDVSAANLLSGEVAPADEPTRVAFAAARNVWLYPYAANSAEVTTLKNLYNSTLASGGTATDGRKALCLITLSAPQFWLGNPGEDDNVRKLALELAKRVPNFADFTAYRNKSLTLADYVKRLQAEPAYQDAVADWHTDWLGLRAEYERNPNFDTFEISYPTHGATGMGSVLTYMTNYGGSAAYPTPRFIREAGDVRSPQYDGCVPPERGTMPIKIQTFDPQTVMIIWDQLNGNTYQVLGGWVLAGQENRYQLATGLDPAVYCAPNPTDTRWLKCDGLYGGARSSLNNVKVALSDGEQSTWGRRRFRRFAPGAGAGVEQDGYSMVRGYYSNAPMYVCNSVMRYWASCAFRPPAAKTNLRSNFDFNIPNWNAAWNGISLKGPALLASSYGESTFLSIHHPEIIQEMRCGPPNTAELAKGLAFNEDVAFPRGSAGNTNDVAVNIRVRQCDKEDDMHPECGPRGQIGIRNREMHLEPYRLIDTFTRDNEDYRNLLTAEYTLGTESLEIFYRGQGLALPTYPLGYRERAANDPARDVVRKIYQKDISPLPVGYLASSYGATTKSFPRNDIRTLPNSELPSKPMSGILTMPAFLGPLYSGTPRTVASRYFTRLMCGQANIWQPTSESEAALHRQYIPAREASGAHVDPARGCVSCHINIDPLGAALYADYNTRVNTKLWDIPLLEIGGSGPPGSMGGGKVGTGAVLGKPARGVKEVAQIVANSRLFARCVVQTAFTNLYGRMPSSTMDLRIIDSVTDSFMKGTRPYNYNQMIQDIIVTPQYLKVK